MLTAERLREVLDYCPETGKFSRNGTVRDGTNSLGYVQIMIDRRMHSGHRLAWLYTYGEWPRDQIDHINGQRSDNRIANLRDSSQGQNCGNMARHKDNKSGYKGVIPFRTKWAAQICRNGVKHHIGVFKTPEEAHAAYCVAVTVAFGEFARVA